LCPGDTERRRGHEGARRHDARAKAASLSPSHGASKRAVERDGAHAFDLRGRDEAHAHSPHVHSP
jgi:hypothetical protein